MKTSGRRAGQRFDATLGVTTEALIFLGDLDPDQVGANIEFATHYEPTPIADCEAILDALEPVETNTFVDVGSGMGRAVILASRRRFLRIVGIEISPALHEIAKTNLRDLDDPLRRCRDVRLVRSDAAAFVFPVGPLAVYLYNPFRIEVFSAMLDRLDGRTDVTIAYHTPLERAEIERRQYDLTHDLGFARIYRSKASLPSV